MDRTKMSLRIITEPKFVGKIAKSLLVTCPVLVEVDESEGATLENLKNEQKQKIQYIEFPSTCQKYHPIKLSGFQCCRISLISKQHKKSKQNICYAFNSSCYSHTTRIYTNGLEYHDQDMVYSTVFQLTHISSALPAIRLLESRSHSRQGSIRRIFSHGIIHSIR